MSAVWFHAKHCQKRGTIKVRPILIKLEKLLANSTKSHDNNWTAENSWSWLISLVLWPLAKPVQAWTNLVEKRTWKLLFTSSCWLTGLASGAMIRGKTNFFRNDLSLGLACCPALDWLLTELFSRPRLLLLFLQKENINCKNYKKKRNPNTQNDINTQIAFKATIIV